MADDMGMVGRIVLTAALRTDDGGRVVMRQESRRVMSVARAKMIPIEVKRRGQILGIVC